ncbi:conserved membrane protein of unknown function [Xenorhabdus poinarii G6]|uniref:Anaerobic dimethyl sulfoxide reductase chain C n=1 Tax=Xenorhabdus poinarii G6 TaxID=1354304 RepID=A0A068R2Y8_9GAMM|nr:DmsC/YnfH family molybdoenzyme membrane anchor subunit [Xenorhabdus poinarii]CDG21399.1 conserved membrane protein of unknown function [Xenorhabdus poinarii G6]
MVEWLLVAFTMVVQSSVGLVLMSGLYIYWFKCESNTWQYSTIFVQKILLRTLLVSSLLAGVGLITSLNVMEHPFRVYCILQNVMPEWINIETAFASIYFGSLVLYTLFFAVIKRIHLYIILIIGGIGLIDLYYMAIICVQNTMFVWNNVNTYFLFYGAVFTLGPALSMLFIGYPLAKRYQGKLPVKLVMSTLLVVFISVIMRIIEHPAYMEWLTEITKIDNDDIIYPNQVKFNIKSDFGLKMLSWCLYIIAMTLWTCSLWKGKSNLLTNNNYFILLGAAIVFIAEIINQYTFFMMLKI